MLAYPPGPVRVSGWRAGSRGGNGVQVGWKLPALSAVLIVVALTLAGVAAGQVIGGPAGAFAGAVPGALAAVVAGFVPSLRDADRSRRAELARRLEHRAGAQAAWAAIGEPVAEAGRGGPAALLRPDRGVVDFTGREKERDALRAWWVSDRRRSARVVVGAGGVGKTRLALKVAEEWAAGGRGWQPVAAGKEASALAVARNATSGPVLLVVDYAETRSGLEALLGDVLADRGVVRVLLIARSLGEWWERLIEKSAPAVGGLLTEAAPVRLEPPVTADVSDAALVAAAMPYFARALGMEAPARAEFELPAGRVPILVAHAAALIAVLRSAGNPAAPVRVAVAGGVLNELLEHEARYWRRTAAARGLPDDGPLVKPIVAAAALLGAGSVAEAAEVVARVPDLSGTSLAQRRRWARWLYGLYPAGADGRLGSLQPDLLAEQHVTGQLAADPELARGCLCDLGQQQAEHALTILARAWAHQDDAKPIIAAALCADLVHLAAAAATVALQTRSDMAALLAAALADAPVQPGELARIVDALPYPSVVLAEAALAATWRIRESLPPDADPGTRADWSERAGLMLAHLGQPAEALRVTEEAVTIRRQLAAASPGRHSADLARLLTSMTGMFRDLGEPAEALRAAEEAVTIRREVAAASPGRHDPDLPRSLINLSLSLSAPGRHTDALRITEEAVTGFRELATASPDGYRPELAQALNNLGIWLSELGRPADALLAAEESFEIRRELAASDPDRYHPALAQSLDNLGFRLCAVGRPADALPFTEEAVTMYRQITTAGPGRWRSGLGTALDNLGVTLADLGRPADALPATEEAVAIYRELAAARPARWRPNLATALTHLSTRFADLGRPADGLLAAEEAVATYRELAAADPSRHHPGLVTALHALGAVMSALGHAPGAEAAHAEAQAIHDGS